MLFGLSKFQHLLLGKKVQCFVLKKFITLAMLKKGFYMAALSTLFANFGVRKGDSSYLVICSVSDSESDKSNQ
jgi:hypothetical protein